MRLKDLAFWTVPAAIGAVAIVLGLRALRGDRPEAPSSGDKPEPMSLICPTNLYRCSAGTIAATTGEENPGGETPCLTRDVGRCKDRCVADGIALVGVSDDTAKVQLCDPPSDVSALVSKELTVSDLVEDGGGSCVADGFGPSEDGVLQCILPSAKDPDALGLVVGRITCRTGVVATIDDTPRIVSRAQAIALWCRRDAAALTSSNVSLDGGGAGADAGADADTGADAGADASESP